MDVPLPIPPPSLFSSGGGVSFPKFKVRVLTPIQVKCSNPNGSGGQAAPVFLWRAAMGDKPIVIEG